MNKNLLCFTARYLPGFQGGGPAKSISNIVSSCKEDINFLIITNHRDAYEKEQYKGIIENKWNRKFDCNIFYWRFNFISFIKVIKIILRDDIKTCYFNSFFSFRFTILPLFILRSLRKDLRIILAPRGEFSYSALKSKSLKKQFYLNLFLFLRFYKYIEFHATSKDEIENIIKYLPIKYEKISFIKNLHSNYTNISKSSIRNSSGELKIIFLSRVTPMKNLDFAIEVLSQIPKNISIKFDIYGVIADKIYWNKCLQKIKNMPKNIICNYLGAVKPSQVLPIFRRYDLLFLPSLGENFGHVIPEALSQGTSVLTSNQVPWDVMNNYLCGWCLSLDDKKNFIDIIIRFSKFNNVQYEQQRKRCLDFSKDNFLNKKDIKKYKSLFLKN